MLQDEIEQNKNFIWLFKNEIERKFCFFSAKRNIEKNKIIKNLS